MNRRHFLMSTAALAASRSVFASPSETVRIAVIGCGGRGMSHVNAWTSLPNVELAAICDVDDAHIARYLTEIEKKSAKGPKTIKAPATFKDIRRILDDKSIDAVSLATPNHWHTLQTIWACQAGKDVYVEKPCSHNIFEAQQIVAAARKYNRMVQQGSQSRSSSALQEAVQKMREGVIGDLYMARALCFKWRDTIGRAKPEPVPAGVDYDMWTGPSPLHQFTQNRFHYKWHWFWDTGNGDLGNQGIHEMDIARWGLGVKYPTKVSAIGGHFMFDDDQETPNTLNCAFEFNESGKHKMMEFEVRHWMSNHEAGINENKRPRPGAAATAEAAPPSDGDGPPPARAPRGPDPNTIGNLFYGSGGYLAIDGYNKYYTFLGKDQKEGPSATHGDNHFANFIEAVRTRKRETLNAEIEEGAASTVLVHLANISYRVGRTLNFDAKTMTCIGDAKANELLTRNYRKGYVVPKLA
jgi:predicted dehydrogenase